MGAKGLNFQEVFDLDAERKRKDAGLQKVISFQEYLEKLREDPAIAQNAPSRLREIVLEHGVRDIPVSERWLGVAQEYSVFSKVLYGVEKPISDFMEYLGTGAAGLSTGKQPVVFVGPPASGNSSALESSPKLSATCWKAADDRGKVPV